MPPDNTNPVAKTESSEFEFEAKQQDNPRLKKRNLKAAAQTAGANVSRPATEQARPAVYAQPAAATHSTPAEERPAYARPSGTEQRPSPAPATGVLYYSSTAPKRPEAMKAPLSPSQATRLASGAAQAASHSLPQRTAASQQRAAAASPSAQSRPAAASASTQTRPATSYSQRPATTQHTAPTRPASTTHTPVSSTTHPTSHSTHPSSATRPASSTGASTPRPASSAAAAAAATQQVSRAVSTHVAGPASASRPSGVSDYRANIDRQSREQKSVGNILNIFVYGLAAFLILGAVLAAYGAHDVYKQLHAQSTTVTELDKHYADANQRLTDSLNSNIQATQQLQTQLAKAQELILRQQDALTKLQASLDAQAEALRQERSTRAAETSIRAQETSALRSRIRSLEAKNEPYRP